MLRYISSGSRYTHFIESTTKGSPRGKKHSENLGFLSKVEMDECDQNVWNAFDQLEITISCSATNFLEVGARVSLKVATKVSSRGKKSSESLDF